MGEATTSKAGRKIEVDCHLLVLAQHWIASINQRIDHGGVGPAESTLEYAHVLGSSLVPSDGSQARLRSTAQVLLAGGTAMYRRIGGPESICCSKRLSWVIPSRSCLSNVATVQGVIRAVRCLMAASPSSCLVRGSMNPDLPRSTARRRWKHAQRDARAGSPAVPCLTMGSSVASDSKPQMTRTR
jgi:hypothetical protein